MCSFSALDSDAIGRIISAHPTRRFFIVRVVPGYVTNEYLTALFKSNHAVILSFNALVNAYRLHSSIDLVERFKDANWCQLIEEDTRALSLFINHK